jgi:pyridoxal phosphate enzyme (YggS family)
MAELIRGLRAELVRRNLERVQAEIALRRGRADVVEVLAATKYVPAEELGVLADAGVRLLGENRAQDLVAKQRLYPEGFTWDFIGHLQSRKVRDLLGRVRYIHSLASRSALAALERHAARGGGETEVLIEVNVADEPSKSGIAPAELPEFLARSPVRVAGLMTMPPLTADPERSRPYFAALRALAERHGLRELSMGTSQDYLVAVEEGATIVRLGTTLFAPAAPRAP